MRYRSPIPPVHQPFGNFAICLRNKLVPGHCVGIAELIQDVRQFCIFRRGAHVDNVPERSGFYWRRFGIEAGQIERAEIRGGMFKTAGLVPMPKLAPVIVAELVLVALRPGNEMPSIIGRQIDAIGFVVGSDDEAEHIEHVVLAQMLLVDAQHIRRRRRIDLGVIVELEAIDRAQIAALVHAQDHRLDEIVEPPEQVRRRHFVEVPRTDGALDWLEHAVLADALVAAQD